MTGVQTCALPICFPVTITAHLGEQPIKLQELVYSATNATNDIIFGYQERFAEHKYRQSYVSGAFRSNHPQSLDIWHWAQEFNDTVRLNDEFIVENPPIKRTVAVPSEKDFICDTFLQLKCTRPMPVNATPGLVDHF